MEIFAELVDENMIVAPAGTILDSDGNVIKKFNDGVPAKGYFDLPLNSDSFTFKVGDQIINQNLNPCNVFDRPVLLLQKLFFRPFNPLSKR